MRIGRAFNYLIAWLCCLTDRDWWRQANQTRAQIYRGYLPNWSKGERW